MNKFHRKYLKFPMGLFFSENLSKVQIAFKLGLLWAVLEVTAAKFILYLNLDIKVTALTALGVVILSFSLHRYQSPLLLAGIAMVATLLKRYGMPLLLLPSSINSSFAVLVLGLSLSLAALIVMKIDQKKSWPQSQRFKLKLIIVSTSVLMSSFIFLKAGLLLAPCGYLLSFSGPGGTLSYFLKEALPWALISIFAFPIGAKLSRLLSVSFASVHYSPME